MAQTRFPAFSSVVIADDANTANALVSRDSNGDFSARRVSVARLSSSGAIYSGVTSKTASYTVTSDDHTILCDATSGAITLTLPAASGVTGQRVTAVKTDAGGNAVTLDGSGSETINGSATLALSSQWDRATIQSDGSNWVRID